ncbi:reverse transcriptase domain-containing protein [Tanacetum coccineum]
MLNIFLGRTLLVEKFRAIKGSGDVLPRLEALEFLSAMPTIGPHRGKHGATSQPKRIFDSGFLWFPPSYKDASVYLVLPCIISDRGTIFVNDQLQRSCRNIGVTHRLPTAYHPQTRVGKWKYKSWLEKNLERP